MLGIIYFKYLSFLELFVASSIGSFLITLVLMSNIRTIYQNYWNPSRPQLTLLILFSTYLIAIFASFGFLQIFKGHEQKLKQKLKGSLIRIVLPVDIETGPEVPNPNSSKFQSDTNLIRIARIAIKNRNTISAKKEILSLYAKYPQAPEIINVYAFLQLALKDTIAAESAFESAAHLAEITGQKNQQIAYLHNLITFVYFIRNEFKKGIFTCDKILILDPENYRAEKIRQYFLSNL